MPRVTFEDANKSGEFPAGRTILSIAGELQVRVSQVCGGDGACGENLLLRDGVEERLPAKATFRARAGDVVSIRSPGGGGWGIASPGM